MKAVIECIKGRKERNEYVCDSKTLTTSYVKRPWVENYGFIKNTLQADGDELDCYILAGDIVYRPGTEVSVHAVADILCFDGGKRDDKFVCIVDGYDIKPEKLDRIIKRLVNVIRNDKPETIVLGVRNGARWMYHELIKCSVYNKVFNNRRSK